MRLVNVLLQACHVADHCAPAIVIGKIARRAAFSGLAVTALIVNIQAKTGVAQGAAEACVAPAMFCHAMGQQHNGFGCASGQPAIDEKTGAVVCIQPKTVRGHGESFLASRSSV